MSIVAGAGPKQRPDERLWFYDSKPVDVVRYFARDEVTDNEIKTPFDQLQIRTMKDISKNLGKLSILSLTTKVRPFSVVVCRSCQRIRDTAESVLGGVVHYDEKTIVDDAYDTYSEEAVNVAPSCVGTFNFTLVLGSSGSGKTMFALRCLPNWIFPEGEATMFRVPLSSLHSAYYSSLDSDITFPGERVEHAITDKLY